MALVPVLIIQTEKIRLVVFGLKQVERMKFRSGLRTQVRYWVVYERCE